MVRISKTFIRSSAIYTIAGMLPMGSAIILLPFYIAFLSTADFGALSVYFAFALFIQIVTTYSFDTSVYIHFHEFKNDNRKLSSFVSSAFVLMLLIGIGAALVFILSGDLIFETIFTEKEIAFYPYGLMTAATGVFQALFKVHGNLLQSREKPELFLWSNLSSFVLVAVFTVAGLKLFPGTLIGPVGGRLLAALLSGLWALSRIFREFGVHFDYPLLRSTFSFNFYSFIYQLLQWVINYFDRIIMVFFLPLDSVGVYDFAMKCLLIIEFTLNGLHNSFFPKVVSGVMQQTTKESTPEINRYYHGFISVMMIIVCLSVLLFPWLIETFVHKIEFKASVHYMPYIAIIYIFKSMRLFFAAPYGILKYTKPLPVLYLVVSAVKIGFMVMLIRQYAVYGVIVASMLGAIVEVLLLRYNLKQKFRFRYNVFKIVIAPVVLFIVILVMEPSLGNQYPLLVHLFYMIGCAALLWWVYRNEIRLIGPMKILR